MADHKLTPLDSFLLSGGTAILSKTTCAPLERIQFLLQCQNAIVKAGRLDRPYKGVIDCTRRTLANEGLYYFWRGNMVSCFAYFPPQALNFALIGPIKNVFAVKDASPALKFGTNIVSGGLAGMLSLSVIYSLTFARTRLATDVLVTGKDGIAKRQYNGVLDVYKKTLKSDGIRGLHRGLTLAFVGSFVYRGLYFGLYDTLRPLMFRENPGIVGSLLCFVLGYCVTMTAGVVAYPIGTLNKRLMMTSGEPVKYKGSWDCARQIITNEGFMSLMKGLSVSLFRGVAGAGLLVGFDMFKNGYVSGRARGAQR